MNPQESIGSNVKDLIFKFLEGNTTLQEEMNLQTWMEEDSENVKIFEQYKAVWISLSGQANAKKYSAGKAWDKVNEQLESDTVHLENSLQKKTVYSIRQLLKIAAIFILVFFLGGLTSKLIFTRNTIDNKVCEISTPLGSKTHLVLPDGSQVWLNAGSKLTYPRSFDDKERKVALVGEAFFKVQTNKSKPFIVSTGQMNVRALGTAFNVKAYPEDKAITTTLVEGIVKVDGVQGKKQFSYTLKPNQNIILNKEAEVIPEKVTAVSKKSKAVDIEPSIATKVEIKTKVKTELFTSWKDSRWTIEGESLRSLAILLERKYNIVIHIDSYELDKYKFTGTIQNETLEQVLQFLSYTTPLEYEIGKGEVWWNIDRKKEKQYSKILNKTR